DGHAPGVAVVFETGIEREAGSGLFLRILSKTRVRAKFFERCHLDQIAMKRSGALFFGGMALMIDNVLMLRDGEIVFFPCFFDAQPSGGPRRRWSANEICIEPWTRSYLSRSSPSISEMQGDGTVGVARHNHDSGFSLITV